MLEPTPENRARINRVIAEGCGYTVEQIANGECFVTKDGRNFIDAIDYSRDLNACHDVCEAKGITVSNKTVCTSNGRKWAVWSYDDEDDYILGTDLRWLVAQAVAQAVKHGK